MLGSALLVAACGGRGGERVDCRRRSSSTTTAAQTAGGSRFCQLLAETDGEVEESHLESTKHRAQLDGLVAAAPDEVRLDVQRFRDHVREFVDPAVPGSADIERYPDDVRAAVGRIADLWDAAAPRATLPGPSSRVTVVAGSA